MEALALAKGWTLANSEVMKRAHAYLNSSLSANLPAWYGRWGIDYVYGTGAVLQGLAAAGAAPTDPLVAGPARWLVQVQQGDGSWGEGGLSQFNQAYAGVGRPTPSVTAWGLLGLVAAGQCGPGGEAADACSRAAAWLVQFISSNGAWFDEYPGGIGQRAAGLNINYPSYAVSWPLMALARYRAMAYPA